MSAVSATTVEHKSSKAESLAKARAAKAAKAERTQIAEPVSAQPVAEASPAAMVDDPEDYGPVLVEPWHGPKTAPSGYCTCGRSLARRANQPDGRWSCKRWLMNDDPTPVCQKGIPAHKCRTEAPPPKPSDDEDDD